MSASYQIESTADEALLCAGTVNDDSPEGGGAS